MTLEERLLKRLTLWRQGAKLHRECMDELEEQEREWLLHKFEAEAFERCAAELASDLTAQATTAIRLWRQQ